LLDQRRLDERKLDFSKERASSYNRTGTFDDLVNNFSVKLGNFLDTLYYPDNSIKYIGIIIYGFKEFRGKYFFKNGDVYYGGFTRDSITGFGDMKYANGERYIGSWKDGEKTKGKLYFNEDGFYSYSGQWMNNLFHGEGILHYQAPKETRAGTFTFSEKIHTYEGTFVDGIKEGEGEFTYPENDDYYSLPRAKYIGQWSNDLQHGSGKTVFVDGSEFVGEFNSGEPEGYGELFNSEGIRVFSGNYVQGRVNGMTPADKLLALQREAEEFKARRQREEATRIAAQRRQREQQAAETRRMEQARLQRQREENPSLFYCNKIRSYYPNVEVSWTEQKGTYQSCSVLEISGTTITASLALKGFWGDTFYRKYKFYFNESGYITSYYELDDSYSPSKIECYEIGSTQDFTACGGYETKKVELICEVLLIRYVFYYSGGECNDGLLGNRSYHESGYYYNDSYLGKDKEAAYRKACDCN
jgi:hypothetical protein